MKLVSKELSSDVRNADVACRCAAAHLVCTGKCLSHLEDDGKIVLVERDLRAEALRVVDELFGFD